MPQLPVVEPNLTFGLICPNAHCLAQNFFPFDVKQKYNNYVCPKCKSTFVTRIAKVRTGTSRRENARLGNSLLSPIIQTRRFSIRVKDFYGNEDLVEFVNYSPQTFEFKSSDMVCFTYSENELNVVQNFTINHWMRIVNLKRKKGLFGTKITTSALVLICFGLLFHSSSAS